MVRPQPILPVFREHGIDAMVRTYRENLSIRSYRWKQHLRQGVTGVRFLYFLDEINKGVTDIGPVTMAQSAWNTLERMGFPFSVEWQVDPASIKGHPAVFYAGHPSYIEPLVCLAALREFDPKVVATAWLKRISESVSQRVIGIADATGAIRQELQGYQGLRKMLETCWARALTFNVIKHLQDDLSIDEYRRSRRQALSEIISTLADRGSVLLFPSGGEGQKPWVGEKAEHYAKFIRFIAAGQERIPAFPEVLFVPVVIRGSLRAVFRSRIVMPLSPVPLLFRLLPGRPFRIVIREGLSMKELPESTTDAHQVALRLMQRLAP